MTEPQTPTGKHLAMGTYNPTPEAASRWTDLILAIEAEARKQAEDDLNAVNIAWWTCVWCQDHFPYESGADVLRDHSATCHSHPAVKAIAEHIRYTNDANPDPLLVGHSIGCRVFQRPTEENDQTTGLLCVADCADRHRALASAIRR